jgi:hypothetical protein
MGKLSTLTAHHLHVDPFLLYYVIDDGTTPRIGAAKSNQKTPDAQAYPQT